MDDIEYWNNEFDKTRRFLELCSPEVHDHVREQLGLYLKDHPSFPPTSEQQRLWDRYIASNPILQRVIHYTYSPVDAIEIRNDMLLASDINLADDGWYIDFALRDPDFPDDALLRDFLEKMKFDMDRVTAADNWKREGAEESIEELRKHFYGDTWEDDGCRITRVVIDQSFPGGYRDEIIAKRHPDGTITEEYHTHILSKDEPDISRFIDETLIRWMKLFEDDEDLRESAYSRVVCPSCDYKNVLSSYGTFQCLGCGHRFTGEEVKDKEDYVHVHKISGEIEKIPFGLERKYRPLREKIHRKYHFEPEAYWLKKDEGRVKDKIDRHWDLEKIFREAILDWDEETPPAAWLQNALKWRFLNFEKSYRKRFVEVKYKLIKCKQCGTSFRLSKESREVCPSCGNPIDPQDLKTAKVIGADFLKEDLDFSGGSLDNPVGKDGEKTSRRVDLFQGQAGVSPMDFDPIDPKTTFLPGTFNQLMKEQEDGVFRADILRLIDNFDDRIDKLLFLDFYNSCCFDGKPTSHAEMSRLLEEREGIKMTPQGIGKRRKRLRLALEKFFPSNS